MSSHTNPFLSNPFKLTFVLDATNPFTRATEERERSTRDSSCSRQQRKSWPLTATERSENPFMEKRTSHPFTSRNPSQSERSFKTSTILQAKTLRSTTPQRKRVPRPVRLFLKSPSTPAPQPTKLVDYGPNPAGKVKQYTASPPPPTNKGKAEESPPPPQRNVRKRPF